MKSPVSKPVLAIVGLGLALSAFVVWFGLHSRKPATAEVAPVVVQKSEAPAVPKFLTEPAKKNSAAPAAVAVANNISLAVIPISLTNVLIATENNVDAAMKSLPSGTQTYGGIEFWLQGAVQLQSVATRDEQRKNFRASISVALDETNFTDGKAVVTQRGKGIASIYILGGVRFGTLQAGEKFADVVWHYADGVTLRSGLQYDVHLRDWARKPYESPAQLPNALTKVAWHGEHPTRKDRSLRLYRVALVNTHPEKTIQSIEFVSAMTRPSLFVSALTLDPLLPGARPDSLTSQEFPDAELNGQLQLFVQDSEGHPLPGAQVSANSSSKPMGAVAQKFTTDNNGQVLVRFPDSELETLDVSAEHENFSGRKMLWDVKSGDQLPPSYTLKLQPEIKLGGLVVDESDSPVMAADVELHRFWSSNDDSPRKKGEQAAFSSLLLKTDAAGHWEAKGLPSALLDHISANIKHPDFVGTNFNVSGEHHQELLAETFKVVLHRGLEVAGRVTDGSDNLIAGADVWAGKRNYRDRQATKTDSAGIFHFHNVSAGEVVFSASAHGRAADSKSCIVKPDMAEIIFRLATGHVIRGVVQDESSSPISGVRVVLEGNGDIGRTYEFATTTGTDGRFEWDSASAKSAQFYIGKQGYEQLRNKELSPDTDNVVVLHKPRQIQGRVVDANTGNVITKFRIGVGRPPAGDRFYPDYPGMKEYSDPNGMFTLDLSEEEDTYVKAEADDYAEKIERLPAPQNGTGVQVTLRLKPSAALHGVVVSPDGRPLPGVSVTLTGGGNNGSISLDGTKINSYSGSKISVTDAEGKFALQSPPETGGMVVAVGEAGFAYVPVEAVRASSTIVLQPFGKIEGTLKIGGQPGAGKDLILTFTASGLGSSWDAYKRTTDAQGRFTFDNVPPGEVNIQRLIKQGENSWGFSDSTSVTVKPGETAQVSLGDNGAVLAGHIRFEIQPTNEVAPIFEGRLSGTMPQAAHFNTSEEAQAFYQSAEWKALMKTHKNYSLEVKPDGAFTADNVAPGNYSLEVSARVGGDHSWEHPPVAEGNTSITVPESFDPATPIDVGEVLLKPPTRQ